MGGDEIERIAVIEGTAIGNAVRIDEVATLVEELAATRVGTWDFHTLQDEVEEMRCVLRRLKDLLDTADKGMFDTPQFLGNLQELLA